MYQIPIIYHLITGGVVWSSRNSVLSLTGDLEGDLLRSIRTMASIWMAWWSWSSHDPMRLVFKLGFVMLPSGKQKANSFFTLFWNILNRFFINKVNDVCSITMLNYQRVYVVVDLNINKSQYAFKEKMQVPLYSIISQMMSHIILNS